MNLVELIETEDAGRTLRCVGCGFHGIPTFQHGEPILSCPQCGSTPPKPPKVGRNDPCPCDSGRKHKKCCGA